MLRKPLATLCLFFLLFGIAASKHVGGRVYASPQKVNEVTKFNFGIGTGHINGTLRYNGIPKAEILLFMDTKWWDDFHMEQDCEKVKHATTRIPIGKTGARIQKGLGHARGSTVTNEDKKMKKWEFEWHITHEERTFGWYLVIADCHTPDVLKESKGKKKKSKRKRNSAHRINYKIDLMNAGMDHLSADERWLTEIYAVTLIVMIAGWFYFKQMAKKTFGNGPKHLIISFVQVAYIIQALSLVFEIIHQVSFRYNGYGVWTFDFFSELLEGTSQTILSFVLLCIGNGWTIQKRKVKNRYDPSIGEALNNPALLDIDNPVLLLMIVFMFLSIVLQLVNKLYDDSFMKFHDHETYAGMALVMIRCVFGVLFFVALARILAKEKAKGAGYQFLTFLNRIMIFGSLWFLAFPGIVLVAAFCSHYLRHFIVASGVLLTQTLCLFVLSYEFCNSKSMFARFSLVQQDGMLAGFSNTPAYNKYA